MKLLRLIIFGLAFVIIYVALGKFCEGLSFLVAFNIDFITGGIMSTIFWILLEHE